MTQSAKFSPRALPRLKLSECALAQRRGGALLVRGVRTAACDAAGPHRALCGAAYARWVLSCCTAPLAAQPCARSVLLPRVTAARAGVRCARTAAAGLPPLPQRPRVRAVVRV
eukprot:scaffold190033_cov32-Tisochrysis_lutea.AAC.5